MNSVERLSATPIQPKKPGGENVVSIQPQMEQTYTPPRYETPSPLLEKTPTQSTDTSILVAMIAQMETRLIDLSRTNQQANKDAVKASVIGAALGVFQALAAILSVRLLMLLTLAGGFFLAVSAMQHQTVISVFVLIAYSVLIIFPTAAIEY